MRLESRYRTALVPKGVAYIPPPQPLFRPDLVLKADARSPVIDRLAQLITNKAARYDLDKVLKENSGLHDLINGRSSKGDSLLSFAVKLNSPDMVRLCLLIAAYIFLGDFI